MVFITLMLGLERLLCPRPRFRGEAPAEADQTEIAALPYAKTEVKPARGRAARKPQPVTELWVRLERNW